MIHWVRGRSGCKRGWVNWERQKLGCERESEGMINQQSADLDAKERESEYVINWDTDRPACERKRERER